VARNLITKETLTPIVRQALDQPMAVPATWEITSIHGGWGSAVGGTALYRIAGQTETKDAWSLVLKILYERPGETVDSPYYWKREYELYRSQMLATLPQIGLTTPRIYHCAEVPNACWIWMEDIQQEKQAWDWADYRLVALSIYSPQNPSFSSRDTRPDHLCWLHGRSARRWLDR
jgi:hypothetical protein